MFHLKNETNKITFFKLEIRKALMNEFGKS